MSSTQFKSISLIFKYIHLTILLDTAYSATKPPFSPTSTQVQQTPFSITPDYQAFL